MGLLYYLAKMIKKIQIPAIKDSKIHRTSKVGSATNLLNVNMEKYSYIGSYCTVVGTKIGCFCSIANNCSIGCANHTTGWVSTSPVFHEGKNFLKKHFSTHSFSPNDSITVIGNDVWIGSNVVIKSGVTIEDGAVIGMGSVVTKNIGKYEIWAGNPAKLIKKRFSDDIISELSETEWWKTDDLKLAEYAAKFNDVQMFLSNYKKDSKIKKVLHLCLASFYIDNYSYQENMLPKFHKKLGLDVEIIASLVSFDSSGKPSVLDKEGKYINEYGIPVTRLGYKKTVINRILRRYNGTYDAIKKSNPDIIFIHGCQFMDIKYIKKYCRKNPNVKIYVDNHADFSNSAKSFFSKNILHKVIWKHCAKLIEPFTEKFFGVLPARVDFLKNIYKVSEDKVELLVMGADDEIIDRLNKSDSKQKIRVKHDIKDNDFLVVTGGKIDKAKLQIINLMEAVKGLEDKNVKLIVFGSVIDELKDKVSELVDGGIIQFVGWVNVEESYEYLSAADLALFPGRHSVYWEQAAGIGIPMIVKYWEGTTHVNIDGNCRFLYKDSIDEIRSGLLDILENPEKFKHMIDVAQNRAKNEFLYSKISLKSIDYMQYL